MEIELTLTARSPLLIGGKKLGGNYNRSQCFIPGGVLRAAIARVLLDRCPYYDPMADTSPRRYWVTYQGRELCHSCLYQAWCRDFDKIIYRDAWPADIRPCPLTALECKFQRQHPVVDTLLRRARELLTGYRAGPLTCPECGPEGRLEGVHAEGVDSHGRRVNLRRQLVTRVGIDPATRTRAEGRLYSLDFLADFQEGKRLQFTTIISVPGLTEPVLPFRVLRAGGYVTSGSGKLNVTGVKEGRATSQDEIRERIFSFNSHLGTVGTGSLYFSLTLYSDADLHLAERLAGTGKTPAATPDAVFHRTLEQALKDMLHPEVKLMEAFTEHEVRRGWDTAGERRGAIKPATLWTRKGSVFLVAIPEVSLADILPALADAEYRGLGYDRETGCGQVMVCDPFHLKFATKEGENYGAGRPGIQE